MRTTVVIAAAVLLVVRDGRILAQSKKKKGDDRPGASKDRDRPPTTAPAPGAVVQLKNTKTLQIRSFIAKEHGAYYFHGLSPDVDYELKAEFQGRPAATKTLSSFDSRKRPPSI